MSYTSLTLELTCALEEFQFRADDKAHCEYIWKLRTNLKYGMPRDDGSSESIMYFRAVAALELCEQRITKARTALRDFALSEVCSWCSNTGIFVYDYKPQHCPECALRILPD